MTRRSAALFVAAALSACAPPSTLDGGVADGGIDAGADEDAGLIVDDDGGVVTAATIDARCADADRVGLVELRSDDGYVSAYASLFDRPSPWLGPPTLADASCGFFEGPDESACSCDLDFVCNFDGICVARPVGVVGLRLVLRAGDDEEVLREPQGAGTVGGVVTLPGTAFAVEVRGAAQVITLAETAVPGPLAGVSGSLTGTYDAPEAIDIAWDAPADGATVFTHIPINHHVGSRTFTECTVDANVGALHVDEAMIAPLAVSTGLEFQGISHVRFAAAETPIGCVELRLFSAQYVDLGF